MYYYLFTYAPGDGNLGCSHFFPLEIFLQWKFSCIYFFLCVLVLLHNRCLKVGFFWLIGYGNFKIDKDCPISLLEIIQFHMLTNSFREWVFPISSPILDIFHIKKNFFLPICKARTVSHCPVFIFSAPW